MARKYINPARPSPKFTKFSLPSRAQKLKTRRPFHTNVFEPNLKHSISFKSKLHKQLPLRFRTKLEMAPRTRSKTAGPKSVSPSGPGKITPPPKFTSPTGSDKSAVPASGSQKRGGEATEDDEDRYAKRVKLEQVTSINSDVLTNKKKDSQMNLDNYFLSILTQCQQDGRAKLRFDWDRMPVQAQKGMKNYTSALCYRLSSFQALLHLPVFVNWVMDFLKPADCVSDKKAGCVSCCLYSLVTEYWDGADVLKTLKRFNAILKKKGWGSDIESGQADPDDQVVALFKFILEEIPTKIYSTLDCMTALKYSHILTCPDCGYKAKKHNIPSHNLSLSLAEIKATSLLEYIENYTEDTIYGWRCHSCKKTVDARRPHEFSHFPDILTIQLKRGYFDPTRNRFTKIMSEIRIPQTLDLTDFESTESAYPGPGHSGKVEYELSSVISHTGSLTGGHYICHAAGPDGEWLKYNDFKVTKSSAAIASRNSIDDFTPYILYYQKKR